MAHTAVQIERIREARNHIDPVFLDSPQFECEPLGDAVRARVVLKVETLNPIRSFKGRGAEWLLASEAGDEPLVCASAGNFGQAMAYACRSRALPLTVFAAESANALKVARMRALGAEVRLSGRDFDAAKESARAYAERSGARFVEDGREPAIAEGAGTLAVELLAAEPMLDAVVVPLGNGALAAGVGTVVREIAPEVRVIAVVASGAPAMARSLRAGRLVETTAVDTIADGIAVRVPVPEALTLLRDRIDDVVEVSDDGIIHAMRLLHEHGGVVVEPAGAVGVAALLAGVCAVGTRVATVLCGGNVTPEQARAWLSGP